MSSTGSAPGSSVNVNKVATLRNSRGGAVPERRRGRARRDGGRRAGHHRPPARRRAAHHAGRRARPRRRCWRRGADESSSTSKAIRGPICIALVLRGAARPVHARAGHARRDHEPGGLAADTPRGRAVGDSSRSCRPRRPRQPVRRSRGRRRSRWAAALGADRVELYTEPFARAFERGDARRRASFARYVGRRDGRARARPGRQRRPRSRSRQPRAVPHAAAPRRSVDRPRAHQPRAVRRPRPRGARLRRGRVRSLSSMLRERRGHVVVLAALVAAVAPCCCRAPSRPARSASPSAPRTACRSRRPGTSRARGRRRP